MLRCALHDVLFPFSIPMPSTQYHPDDSYRDSLSTIGAAGERVWLYPKKPAGRFYRHRKWLSYGFLALLLAGPWLRGPRS